MTSFFSKTSRKIFCGAIAVLIAWVFVILFLVLLFVAAIDGGSRALSTMAGVCILIFSISGIIAALLIFNIRCSSCGSRAFIEGFAIAPASARTHCDTSSGFGLVIEPLMHNKATCIHCGFKFELSMQQNRY